MGTFLQTTYDKYSNVKTVTTYRGNLNSTTTYNYDVAGNILSETAPWGGTKHYVYDKEGNQTQATTASGKVTDYTYKVIERTDVDGTSKNII